MSVNLLTSRKSFVELLPSSVSAYFLNQAIKAICPQSKLTGLFIETLSNL
jgi:hypothetical protein